MKLLQVYDIHVLLSGSKKAISKKCEGIIQAFNYRPEIADVFRDYYQQGFEDFAEDLRERAFKKSFPEGPEDLPGLYKS